MWVGDGSDADNGAGSVASLGGARIVKEPNRESEIVKGNVTPVNCPTVCELLSTTLSTVIVA